MLYEEAAQGFIQYSLIDGATKGNLAAANMLGYDNKADFKNDYLLKNCDPYDFSEISKEKSRQQLLEDIPKQLYLSSDNFASIYDKNASCTPANKEMIREAAKTLLQHGEITVQNRNPRSNIQDGDILCLNPQKRFYFPK